MFVIAEGMKLQIEGERKHHTGIVSVGPIVKKSTFGEVLRKYTWVKNAIPRLEGKTFEAYDHQIYVMAEKAIRRRHNEETA